MSAYCYVRNRQFVHVYAVFFLSCISLFLGSCSDFNIFAIVPPSLDKLISGNIDEFIYALDRLDVIQAFKNDKKSRAKAIDTLQKKIKSDFGSDKIKNEIGLAAVLTKTTELSEIYRASSLSTLLNTSEDSIGDMVGLIFVDVKDNADKISRIVDMSLLLRDTLSDLGDSIEKNGVPAGHEEVARKYAGAAVLSGMIAFMVDTIVNKDGSTITGAEARSKAAVQYLAGTSNGKYKFDLGTPPKKIGETLFEGANAGLEKLLRSGNFEHVVDTLEEKGT